MATKSDLVHEKIKEQKENICKNSPNLSKEAVNDLEAALVRLHSLTFKAAKQKDLFFENLQCLQGYHIIQVFNTWAASRLQDSLKEPQKSTTELVTLFEICSQFCNCSPIMSNRISFEVFIRTVKFCFPSDSKKHYFSTKIVLMLLELMQILQEGKLTFPALDSQKKDYCIKSAADLFEDLIAILEARDYYAEDILDIISQASKFARADSKHKPNSELVKTFFPNLQAPFDDLIPAISFKNWGDLLQLTTEGDVAFILRLASEDPLYTPLPGTISPLFHMVGVLQELERKGEQVDLGCEEERRDIFFKHMYDIFRDGYEMTATSLKIFSWKKVNDADLAEVCNIFFLRECKEPRQYPTYRVQCFQSIKQLLHEIPDGSLVTRILKFWIESFPNDLEKAELKKLLDLFIGLFDKRSTERVNRLQEKAERLLGYIANISKLLLIHPLPGVPGVLEEFKRLAYSFLKWISQEVNFSEDAKGNMVALFARCFNRTERCDQFSCEIVKSLCLCKGLSLEYKETFSKEVVNFFTHLDENEKDIIVAFVSKVSTSSQSLDSNQQVFSELLETLNQLSFKHKLLKKQTRSKTFQLIMDLAKAPLTSMKSDNIVRILRHSRNSKDDLSCYGYFLRVVTSATTIVKERAQEYFDILFSAIFETLNGSTPLTEVFSIHHRKMTDLQFDDGVSVDVMTIWNVIVAGLLAVGTFKEKVDSHCCLPVFARAKGFNSPFEALLLYFELRLVFCKVIFLLRNSPKRGNREPLPQAPVGNLVDALKIIVQSDVLTTEAKLRLIRKLLILVQRKPWLLTGNTLPCTLMNVIPLSCKICQSDKMKHLDFELIATIIERPGMVERLGSIPSTPSKSMCSVLCSNIADVGKIYDCVASFRVAKQAFLEHMLLLLESTIKVSSSAIEVVRLLKEAEELLCKFDSQLMPLAVSIFSYLVENNVAPKERLAFIALVSSRWETTCDSSVCSRYEIPHILWKAYESSRNGKGTLEATDQIHELIERVKDLETRIVKEAMENPGTFERGSTIPCDLEWLALHSSLSGEDVALCFHLSCCYPGVHRLTCFSPYAGSGSQIQDGHSLPLPPRNDESKNKDDFRSRTKFSSAAQYSFEQKSKALTPASLLTPGKIAEKMMKQLRRLLGDDINLCDIAVKLWNSLFASECLACPDEVCKPSDDSSACDNVARFFLYCLEKAPYFEVVPFWFDNEIRKGLSQHHVLQCSEVIFGSCGWNAQSLDKEGHLNIQVAIISILQDILRSSCQFPGMPLFPHTTSCFRGLKPQLESLLCILQKFLPFQVTFDLLQLARRDLQAATTIATIFPLWTLERNEAQKLLEEVKRRIETEGLLINPLCKDFVWSMLEACGRVYRDSSKVLLNKLEWLTDLHGLDVLNYGLDRLSNWRRLMTADGHPAHVIDKWCVFFLFTPKENFSLRDVDAVLDLNPSSLQLVKNSSENIKRCLFSGNGFRETHLQEEESPNPLIKEHLRLARFLSELIHILKLQMSEKTVTDAVVERIVVQACNKLCKSHMEKIKKEEDEVSNTKNRTKQLEDKQQQEEDKTNTAEDKSKKRGDVTKRKKEQTNTTVSNSKRKEEKEVEARTENMKENEGEKTADKTEDTDDEPKIAKDETKSRNPYSILRKTLEALFNELFAKQPTIADNPSSFPNCGEALQGQESELSSAGPFLKGSTLPPHNLPNKVYESMLVLMRRWLSGIANKPTLASNTMKIVKSLFSFSYEKNHSQIKKLQDEIRLQILSFARNQLLLSQFQAAGYNQGDLVDSRDLWASPSLELSCFLSKSEFPSEKRYETKLTNVLRLHWSQWKDLLFMLNIHSIKIDDCDFPTRDLFGIQASLDQMEKQVAAAIKEIGGRIECEDVTRRVTQLIREEQRHRARVTKFHKRKETDKPCKNKTEKGKTKLVAVWENRFLENIKLCSELIPGCYAPNGFHSEKPVICALSVDNRILTVFKEEKGRREEIENVEVKLFEAGLYVYGLHTSGHDYVTDELWAAFYKMLLEKRLVPTIVLSNESPGFHWIKKFVQPVKVHPCFWKWHLHCGIVPPEEDYLDYRPIEAALCPWLHGLSEYLTLTRINVARFRFRDFTDAQVVERKEQQAKEVARKFKATPQLERELHSLHNDALVIEKLPSKLEFAVKKTLTQIVKGEWPTTETVKKHIDMRRLAFIKCEECKLKIQKCHCKSYHEDYATIVLRVCENVRETLLVLLFCVFLVNLFALD